jgi:hypothetical protein
MKIKEILLETSQEINDLAYIAKTAVELLDDGWFKKTLSRQGLPVSIMLSVFGQKDAIKTDSVRMLTDQLLILPFLGPGQEHSDGFFHAVKFDENSGLMYVIHINPEHIKTPRLAQTILIHELQHALDHFKSSGKALGKPVDFNQSDFTNIKDKDLFRKKVQKYMSSPDEVNARFSEACLHALDLLEKYSKQSKIKWKDMKSTNNYIQKIPEFVNYCLSQSYISREYFAPGPKGDKQFNRIKARLVDFVNLALQTDLPNLTPAQRQNWVKRTLEYFRGLILTTFSKIAMKFM